MEGLQNTIQQWEIIFWPLSCGQYNVELDLLWHDAITTCGRLKAGIKIRILLGEKARLYTQILCHASVVYVLERKKWMVIMLRWTILILCFLLAQAGRLQQRSPCVYLCSYKETKGGYYEHHMTWSGLYTRPNWRDKQAEVVSLIFLNYRFYLKSN